MSNAGNHQRDWLESISRNRQPIAYALFALGAAFAVLAVVLVIRYRTEYPYELVLCAATALAAVAAGMWQLTRESGQLGEADTNRLFILCAGACTGLLITLLGLGLIVRWRATLFGGVEAWQGEQSWTVWVSLGVFFLGLATMFVSLMVARAAERTNPTLRRLIYGYNAVLSCILLAAVLVVVNILGYLYLPVASDWTASALYTLSSESKNVLEGLDKPVRVFVLQSGRSPDVANDVRTLMENFQAHTNKLQVEYVSIHRQLERFVELESRYQIVDPEGILVVYGNEPDAQHQFVKDEDLADRRMARGRPGEGYTFNGEDAVISTINYLSQGKSKPVIYFTQGNGELDLNETDSSRPDRGLAALRERLEKGNYEAKGLQLVPVALDKTADPRKVVSNRVPDDAVAVVLAGPRRPLSAEALAALTEYMNRDDPKTKAKAGKLIVMLDVATTSDGAMVQTGLEKWLEDYNVEVGNNRLLQAEDRYRTRVIVTPNPRLRSNPIVRAFLQEPFLMVDARTVRPRPSPPGAPPSPSRFRAEELLMAAQTAVWAESNLRAEPGELVADMIKNRRDELNQKIKEGPLCLAVAVSEAGGLPDIPEHRGMAAPDGRPRMLVFGDATLASNALMSEGGGLRSYDLFASSLAWLRERPQNIGIKAKKRDTYTMDQGTNLTRLVWLPLILMLAASIGLGAGVWVVRRR